MVFRKLLIISMGVLVFGAPAAWSAETGAMSVQVKQSPVRTAPSFMARIIGTLHYGDRVQVVSSQGSWTRVDLPGTGLSGWVHVSALTRKRLSLKAGAEDVNKTATSDELALAGKGFNKKVENAYRDKNRELDYSRIDAMEKVRVSQSDIRKFLKEGGVSPQGGVQ